MFRKTFTGSLVAASLTASALMFLPSASATPTVLPSDNVSNGGLLPTDAHVVMAENGAAAATWIRKVVGEDRVQASYRAAGVDSAWSAPATVSLSGEEVANPNVGINDKGEAVVSWLQKNDDNLFQVTINRHASGAFGVPEVLGEADELSAAGEYDVAVDGAGRFWAAYQANDNATTNVIRAIVRPKDIGWTQWHYLSDDSAFAPDLAVNSKGQALLAFYNAGNGASTIDTRRLTYGDQDWSAVKSVGVLGQYRVESETALSDDGTGTVAYVVKDIDGDWRASSYRANPDGTLSNGVFVSPDTRDASNISLAQNDKGEAHLSWNDFEGSNDVRYATRYGHTADWTNKGFLSAGLSKATAPQSTISDSGTVAIGYVDDGHVHAAYRTNPYVGMSKHDYSPIPFVDGETSIASDSQGNILFSGIGKTPDNTHGQLRASFIDVAGPTATLANLPANTLNGKVKLTWSATDRLSAVSTYDVRVTTTAWNSTVGKTTSVLTAGPAQALDFTPAAGRTHCFEVRARDAHNNTGSYAAPKCTTTPVDDRAGVIAKGFKRAKASTSYLGTYSIAKKKNAVLSLQHVKAKRIAILVTKVAKGGKIKVTFGGTTIGTYSLKGSGNKQLVAAKTFSTVKTGTLVVKVISADGKVVRIDGVVVAK